METVRGEQEFQERVLASERPVLVDFYADWCGPCRVMTPLLEELDQERTDVDVIKLDVDDDAELAVRYGVRGIPTMILFVAGEERRRLVGARSKAAVASELALGLATGAPA